MDKDRIAKSAVTSWDEENGGFVTRSTVQSLVMGAGLTINEAYDNFMADLEIQYQHWLKGTHGILSHKRKSGRPSTGRQPFTTSLKPDIKTALDHLASLHKKSRPQIIEILIDKASRNEVTI